MPRFQKLLIGARPDEPADDVARTALTERLLAVVQFLDKSIGEADEAEAIHQLRVWSRRASAALKLFEPALPNSRRKWMKRALRKLLAQPERCAIATFTCSGSQPIMRARPNAS